VLIHIVMMQHVLAWVKATCSLPPTVTWWENNKSVFKPLSSFVPVTNLLVPSRAMGASNPFIKVCHHFPTISIAWWWETANLVWPCLHYQYPLSSLNNRDFLDDTAILTNRFRVALPSWCTLSLLILLIHPTCITPTMQTSSDQTSQRVMLPPIHGLFRSPLNMTVAIVQSMLD